MIDNDALLLRLYEHIDSLNDKIVRLEMERDLIKLTMETLEEQVEEWKTLALSSAFKIHDVDKQFS